jgi:hypothetical protein
MSAVYTPRPRVSLTVLGDGTGVLLDLETKFYFTLNASSVEMWRALEARGSASAADLGGALARIFEVDAERAEADCAHVLTQLERDGLVTVR